MRRFGKKISFRLSTEQLSDLNRIERELQFRTRSSLLKEALMLLSDKYPDKAKLAKEAPLFKPAKGKPSPAKRPTKADKRMPVKAR